MLCVSGTLSTAFSTPPPQKSEENGFRGPFGGATSGSAQGLILPQCAGITGDHVGCQALNPGGLRARQMSCPLVLSLWPQGTVFQSVLQGRQGEPRFLMGPHLCVYVDLGLCHWHRGGTFI